MIADLQEELATNGIRKNGVREFQVSMNGKRWYDLLAKLETEAIKGDSYYEIRSSVLLAEEIRGKLREGGF